MDELFKNLTQLFANPTFWILCGCYYAFAAFVGSLDRPTEKSSKGYAFAWRFLNRLAANLSRAASMLKVPQTEQKFDENSNG